MSLNAMGGSVLPAGIDPKFVAADRDGAAMLIPMGITSENVAARFGVGRAEQDAFAAESQARAHRAQEEGLFEEEILPVRVSLYSSRIGHGSFAAVIFCLLYWRVFPCTRCVEGVACE